MYASFTDFLKGEPRKIVNNTPVQISIHLGKITKITMVYNSKADINSTKIQNFIDKKLHGTEKGTSEDAMLYKYYKVVSNTAKRIYTKHLMALKAIEDNCLDKGYPEAAAYAMKLLYLTGVKIPDDRNRYMSIGVNGASKTLANYLSLAVVPDNSKEYTEKMYRRQATKALKRKNAKDTK
jgi:hypothetical protein